MLEFSRFDFALYRHATSEDFDEFGCPQVLVANPPYVSQDEWFNLEADVRDFEPKLALVADEYGTAIASSLLNQFQRNIDNLDRQPAVIAMELAQGQPKTLLADHNPIVYSNNTLPWGTTDFFVSKDLEGKDRFLCRIALQRADVTF